MAQALGLPRGRTSPAAAPAGRELVFLFDYASPYTYLASTQIERVAAERGARITWKPILLAGCSRRSATPSSPSSRPARRAAAGWGAT